MEAGGEPAVEVNGSCPDVRNYFVISKHDGGKDVAVCKVCKKPYEAVEAVLKEHVVERHYRKRPLPSLDQPGAEGRSWFNQEQEACDAELARMIAFHGYPSSIVEDECFRRFVHGLNPRFQMPPRAAIEDICRRHAKDAMNKLEETLAHFSGQISLATGTVETGQGKALYMACQFVDDEWVLQKRIMQVFKVVRFPPYNQSTLLGSEEVCLQMTEGILKQFSLQMTSSKLEEAVRRWGLQAGRLFSVAWSQELEKCLERNDFLDGLCPYIQLGGGSIEIPMVFCVTYTSDMLDSVATTLYEALNPQYEVACFKAVKVLHLSHEKRAQNYSELGLNHIGRYDQRWYAYYCALEVLHKEYSDNNEALLQQPRLDSNQILELFTRLTPKEIEAKVRNIIVEQPRLKESVLTDLLRKILGTIYRAIKTLSSSSNPTANLCLEELMKLRAILQAEVKDATTVVAKAVAYAKLGGFSDGKDADVVLREVQDVLDNHLKEAYQFLSVPAILDPRFKLKYVKDALKQVFDSEDAAKDCISSVDERIKDIFEERRIKVCNILNGEGTTRMAAEIGTAAMDIDGYSQEGITELDRYLTDGLVPREGEGFDVLMWWKDNSCRYPTVARMARDALAMPASDMLPPEQTARIRSMMCNYCATYPETPSDE